MLDNVLLGSLDPSLTGSLENQILMLQNSLTSMETTLSKLFDKNGKPRRLPLIAYGERVLKDEMDDFRKREAEFINLMLLVIRADCSVARENHLLSPERFKTIESSDRSSFQVDGASYIRLTSAEIREKALRQVPVLIETPDGVAHGSPQDLKESISQLVGYLAKGVTNCGILKCLGYRENLELVFEVPAELEKPRTLIDLIRSTSFDVHGGGFSLDDRIQLAYNISEVVLNVHLCHFVHKNIRTETILVFQRKAADDTPTGSSTIGVPYLTKWTMLRKDNHTSSRSGDSEWMRNIYRHPQRQGDQPQERYNIRHDIYSLGVCLLEIGLWKPFITLHRGEPRLCDLYCDTAAKLGMLRPQELGCIETLTRPAVVQATLISLAQLELPKRMGTKYTTVVLDCLHSLESVVESEGVGKDTGLIAVKYVEDIVFSLGRLRNWGTAS
jgi:hypothetical protein